MNKNNHLLQPSLSKNDGNSIRIYSEATGYVSAIFGGAIATSLISLLNSYRIGRLRKDWPLGIAAIIYTVAIFKWKLQFDGQEWFTIHFGKGSFQVLETVLGFGFFGVGYLLHRKYYRNMQILGLKAASGWIPGLLAIIASWLMNILIIKVI
jgi:hypothetical protein